jgi:urea transport system ATP-binding protein
MNDSHATLVETTIEPQVREPISGRRRGALGPGVSAHEVSARQQPVDDGTILSLDQVTVSFDGFKALDALTLRVHAGELRCIIGPNGAGKTTMMDVITGKTRPDHGIVRFGRAIDLLKLTEPEIAQAGIGRKFQKPTVFEHLTVFENLELALAGRKSFLNTLLARLTRAQREHIDQVLEQIGLSRRRGRCRMGRSSGSRSVCS